MNSFGLVVEKANSLYEVNRHVGSLGRWEFTQLKSHRSKHLGRPINPVKQEVWGEEPRRLRLWDISQTQTVWPLIITDEMMIAGENSKEFSTSRWEPKREIRKEHGLAAAWRLRSYDIISLNGKVLLMRKWWTEGISA